MIIIIIIIKYYVLTIAYTPELVTLAVALHQCYEASTLSLTQVVVVQLN